MTRLWVQSLTLGKYGVVCMKLQQLFIYIAGVVIRFYSQSKRCIPDSVFPNRSMMLSAALTVAATKKPRSKVFAHCHCCIYIKAIHNIQAIQTGLFKLNI